MSAKPLAVTMPSSRVAMVARAPGWACWRCRKVLPEAGLHPDHPLRLRCIEVITGARHCVHELAAAAFDQAFASAKWAGHPDPVASAAAAILAGPLALTAFWPRHNLLVVPDPYQRVAQEAP